MTGSGVSSSTSVICGFERFPPELLLNVLTRLPDLVALDCLIRASPTAYRVFDEYAVQITEAVLSSPRLTFRHTAIIICIVALIRSSTLPIKNLEDFRRYVTHEAMYQRRFHHPPALGLPQLDKATRPSALRSILTTNRQLVGHSYDCLELYLERFRALRPKHPIGLPKGPHYRPKCFPDGLLGAQSVEFEVCDIGPPSWVSCSPLNHLCKL